MKTLRDILLLCVLPLLASCAHEPQWQRDEGMAWGTTYHITYAAPASLHDSVRAVMRAVELSVSPFEPASRISAVNAGRTDTLDAMLASLVEVSQRVCRESGGAFDPTVMPLVDLWGFGPAARGSEPSQAMIDSARRAVGILECSVDAAGRFVRKHPDTRLDFSAIAKGMGVDAVAAMLRRNGVDRYMVEIGGEVAVGGMNPRGDLWRIQIDAPVDDPGGMRHERMRVLPLDSGMCVATSGNYRNYRTLADGTRAGHIISPLTGRPAMSAVLSATVVAPSCMLADALATASMVMEPDSALAMCSRVRVAQVILAVAAPPDTFRIITQYDYPQKYPRISQCRDVPLARKIGMQAYYTSQSDVPTLRAVTL